MSAIAAHVVLAQGPPTDEQMIDLPSADREARSSSGTLTGQTRDRLLERLDREEALHAAWFVDLDGTPREARSGLPGALVEAEHGP